MTGSVPDVNRRAQLRAVIRRAGENLERRDQLICELRTIEGLSLREIATEAQLTPEGVKRILVRRGCYE